MGDVGAIFYKYSGALSPLVKDITTKDPNMWHAVYFVYPFYRELPAKNKKKVKKRGPRKREMLEREREK